VNFEPTRQRLLGALSNIFAGISKRLASGALRELSQRLLPFLRQAFLSAHTPSRLMVGRPFLIGWPAVAPSATRNVAGLEPQRY
jgi:hypothetical protein